MMKYNKDELLKRIDVFSDSKIIAMELAVMAEDEVYEEGNYPYWLKEAETHIIGLHELAMDLYKVLKQEEAEKYYAVQEQTETV